MRWLVSGQVRSLTSEADHCPEKGSLPTPLKPPPPSAKPPQSPDPFQDLLLTPPPPQQDAAPAPA